MEPAHLPEYVPSPPAPDYSSKPLPGEQSIQRTPVETPYQGSPAFTYKEHGMSLTLRGCREEDGVPTFGLCSTVHGEFEPIDRRRIISVVVKLEGHIFIKDGSRMSSTLLVSKQRTLWEIDEAETLCPGVLPLSISFPANYWDNQSERNIRLPPSLSISRPRRTAVVYSLSIIVRKKRGLLFCMRSSRDVTIAAHLKYSPRIRPPRPAPTYSPTLKQCPDEWQEDIWSIDTGSLESDGSHMFIAQCHFFFPSLRVFSASESIPFHLSFCGSVSYLQSTVQSLTPDRNVGQPSRDTPVHVFLVRQTTVRTKASKAVCEEVLGTGSLVPSEATLLDADLPEDAVSMSWDGELRCESPVTFSGFSTYALEVKDFVVLSLISPLHSTKPLDSNLHHAIPIRIVTHPWIDRS
ncbi:hypothetical protein ID866_5027 [Astraeus odoratus]|nr:hypothetical protein ID866_5027 [Astraeus odoratus]